MQTVCNAKGKDKICLALAALLLVGARSGFAQSAGQKTFKTPQAAAEALVRAAREGDRPSALSILGPGGAEVICTGDHEADAKSHQLFIDKYKQMHRFVAVDNRTDMLYIGAENWPVPIPLVKGGAGWYFDTAGAIQEIRARRIGENELSAISICLAIVAAQNEYQGQLHDGETVKQYAQRFASEDGKHDGLYWKAEGVEPRSPLGPRLALASYQGGPSTQAGEPRPYHGYLFKMLTAQGSNAPGGARSYLEGAKLTKGFAVVAYPARYLVTGVTTFIVNQDGIVWQKDLGPDTAKLATAIQAYNPDSSWTQAN